MKFTLPLLTIGANFWDITDQNTGLNNQYFSIGYIEQDINERSLAGFRPGTVQCTKEVFQQIKNNPGELPRVIEFEAQNGVGKKVKILITGIKESSIPEKQNVTTQAKKAG